MVDNQTDYRPEDAPELHDDYRGTTDETLLTTGQTSEDQVSAPSEDDATPESYDGYSYTTAPCTNDGCENPIPHRMEPVWIELMAPIPVPGQDIMPSDTPGLPEPTSGRIAEVVSALRPDGSDEHALSTICDAWSTLYADLLQQRPELLRLKLLDLAQTWEGEDFDQFAEQVELTRSNLQEALDEIGDGMTELSDLQDQIYRSQGSGGQIPFPAPNVWKADRGNLGQGARVHVRPPWAEGGDCQKDRDQGDTWEILGLPRDTGDRVETLIEERAQLLEQSGMSAAEARTQAEADYEEVMDEAEGHWSNQMRELAEEHNATVLERRDSVAESQGAPSLTHNRRTPSTVSDPDAGVPAPDLASPPSPRIPPAGGLDGYNPPGAQPPLDLPDPQSGGFGGSPAAPNAGGVDLGNPSGGHGSPGTAAGGSGWDPDDDPWGAGVDDQLLGGSADDAIGGGLASGGVGAAGGLPSGGGVAAPSGVAGGAPVPGAVGGAPGIGAGRGGAGRSAAAGVRGGAGTGSAAGRAPAGMTGGGRGGAGPADGETERDTWLTEDEEVWGVVDEEDDPYA